MRKSLRVRIVLGLLTMFGGGIFAVIAPAIAMFLFLEQPSPADLERRLPEIIATIGRAGRIASAAAIIGWAITAAAATYTATTWARWFLGNQAGPTALIET
jgi:hypothetical protein